MMFLIRAVTLLHLAVYSGIMWYGWQSYKLLRKPSWKVMGVGFAVLLVYRARQLVRQMMVDYPIDAENTFLPFFGAVFLLVAFWMLSREHAALIAKLAEPLSLRSGTQPVEYWLGHFDEVKKALKRIEEKLNGR